MIKNIMLTVLLLLAFTENSKAVGVYNSSGTYVGQFSNLKCGNAMTCTSVGNKAVLTSTLAAGPMTFDNGEIINNTVDDTVEILSDDNNTTVQITGFEAKNAILKLYADQGDDDADKYSLTATTSDTLLLKNNATQILGFNSSGVITLPNSDILDNATTDDTLEFRSEDSNSTFQVTGFEGSTANLNLYADEGDDAADKFSLNVSTSDVLAVKNNGTQIYGFSSAGVITYADSETLTNASDVITFGFDDAAAEVRLNAFEATNASLTLQADESDDSGDDWQLTSVASGNTFTISNDTSGSQVAKMTISASAGNVTGPGTGAMSGFLINQVAATATTITADQCGSAFYNSGAVVINLPAGSAALLGCRLTFMTLNASNFDVNPGNSDQILVLTDAAGDAIRNATLGNVVTLQYAATNKWVEISAIGTWSDVN